MSIVRPHIKPNLSPRELIQFLSRKQSPQVIYAILKQYRENDYAENLSSHKAADIICKALTTNDISDINYAELKKAQEKLKKTSKIDTTRIQEAIALILKAHKAFWNQVITDKEEKAEFVKMLKSLNNNPMINLAGLELSNVILKDAHFQFANFAGARLANVDFSGAMLEDCNFRGAKLKDVSLHNANFDRADFKWADLRHATMDSEDMEIYLKDYLETRYPSNAKLGTVPSINDLLIALNDIERELELEHINEHVLSHKLQQRFNDCKYHDIVSSNIVKLSKDFSDAKFGCDFIESAKNHSFFKNTEESRIMRFFNKGINKFCRFFDRNSSGVHLVAFSESILDDQLDIFKEKLKNSSPCQQRKGI